MGFPHEVINNKLNISESGMKLIVKELYENGVERFVDKRKKNTYPSLKFRITTETKRPFMLYLLQSIVKGTRKENILVL